MDARRNMLAGVAVVAVFAVTSHFLGGGRYGAAGLAACAAVAAAALWVWWRAGRTRGSSRPRHPADSEPMKERLSLALSAARTALWDADVLSGQVLLDEGWSAMLGGEPKETVVTLHQLARITHPDDRARVLQLQKDAIIREGEYRADHRVRALSGEWIWIHSRGRVIERGPDGRAKRMIGTNTDITVRKRAEAAMESQKEFLAALQKITLELLEHREIPDLLHTLLDRATALLEASHGLIMLKEGDALVVRATTRNVPAQLTGPATREVAKLSWEAHDSGKPVVIDDYMTRAGRSQELGVALRAVAEFPIMVGGRCLGVLSLGRVKPKHFFSGEERERGILFAQMASLVLRNAGIRAAALEEAAARTVALRESEEKFRGVFHKTPVPMSLSSLPDGRVVEANAAACEMFGYPVDEAIGRTTSELKLWFRDEDRQRFVHLLQTNGFVNGLEVAMRRKTGERIEVLYHGSLVHIGGRPHALNSILDITNRKHTELALRESEEKFRAVFDKGPVAIVLSTLPEGRVADANAAAAAVFGYSLEEQIGKTTTELNIWVDAAQRTRYIELLKANGTIAGFEALLRRRDGKVLTMLFYSSVVKIGDRAFVLNSILDITERKQTEQARDRSLSLMLATLESTADGILVVNSEGGIETFNRTFAAMWRLPHPLVARRDPAQVMDCMLEQLSEPEKFRDKIEYLRSHPEDESFDDLHFKDGRVFERYSRPQFINGLVAGRVWSFRDISARKHAEAAIRESEEKFRGVFDKSPIPVALSALPNGELIEANPAALAVFGFNDQPIAGQRSLALGIWKDPADRGRYNALLREKGSITGFEVTMKTQSGEELAVLLNGSIVQIGGRPYTITSALDITERKRAESRFRDLFEFAPDAILIADRGGKIADVNRKGVELFGYTRDEMAGMSAFDLIAEEVRPQLAERLTKYFEHPVPRPMGASGSGLKACSRDGRVFSIDIGLSPLRTGTTELVVAAVRETTEQERAAEQHRALELQLRQAQKMEALGTLAGGIAHDFNNLLTAILGHSEMAMMDLPPGHPAAGSVTAVRDAGLRSRELVKQILTFSRRTESARAPIKLQTVVEDSFRLLRSTIPAMVRIDRFIEPKCPPVCGDATQIHQVLMNLCTNAWHALPEHGGFIALRLQPWLCHEHSDTNNGELRPGPYLQLSVTDNGHGMDAQTLERIYDPFFTTKPVGKGTGLGLSMVHGIVKAHEGSIRVQSAPGRGTTFHIYFPALGSVEIPATKNPVQIAAGGSERILYVDDDELAGRAITRLLERFGYRVQHRAFPRDALALFQRTPAEHDLVITDLAMPEMPGTELAAEMIRIRPDLPVLLITGYMDSMQDDAVRRIGIRDVLRKPIAPDALADAVRRALAGAEKAPLIGR